MALVGLVRCGMGIAFCSFFLTHPVTRCSAQFAPVNDLFESRTLLSGTTNYVLTSNIGATREPGEPTHAGSDGDTSIWWTWTAQKSGTIAVSTAGSSFDTLLGVYLGASITNLIEVTSGDDDDLGNVTSLVRFRAIAGETYQIAVDGFDGASGAVVLRIGPSGYPQPPWVLRGVNGPTFAASNFVNRVLLLDFFETTCGACITETPDLLRIRQEDALQGFEILGAAKDDSLTNIVYSLRSMGITYPVAWNDTSVESSFGGPLPLPTKILIDREGLIQETLFCGNSFDYYEARIRPLLRGATDISLQIRPQSNRIVLAWPATEFGWGVESTTDLAGGTWRSITNQIVQGPSENNLTLPTADSVGTFYRLKK